MKRLLLDLDGVLVDLVKGACDHHGLLSPYLAGFQGFYLNEAWNMSPKQFWEGMDRKFWAELDWTPDGRQIFDFLHSHFGPENICILTSPCSNDGCFDGKMDWIRKHLPKEYHRRFLVGPAKEFCAHKDAVLVDDYEHNIDNFMNASGNGILIPRQWNRLRSRKHESLQFLKEALNHLRRCNDY